MFFGDYDIFRNIKVHSIIFTFLLLFIRVVEYKYNWLVSLAFPQPKKSRKFEIDPNLYFIFYYFNI
jgi:hypothetical protein